MFKRIHLHAVDDAAPSHVPFRGNFLAADSQPACVRSCLFPSAPTFESHMRAAQPRVYTFGATGSLSESAGSGRPASTAGVGGEGFNHRLTGGGEAARLIDCRRRVCIRGLGGRVVVVGGVGVGGFCCGLRCAALILRRMLSVVSLPLLSSFTRPLLLSLPFSPFHQSHPSSAPPPPFSPSFHSANHSFLPSPSPLSFLRLAHQRIPLQGI